jgi:hypothetical protein
MDKLIGELIVLLRDLLGSQQRLLQIAKVRQSAMQAFDIERLNGLMEEERLETAQAEEFENRRRGLIQRFRQAMGVEAAPSVSDIAGRCGDPEKSQLLVLAGQLKGVLEQLDRHTRMNAKISESVVKGLAKVLKVMTGLAQHAGLYMRNGRKAAMKGIHLLEVTG